jgi:site-specific DNA recombinase
MDMRVALYARYSNDNQSVASIEDQFRICREHAGRERWQIVDTYHDAAISGASVILRPGVRTLLQDAQRGKFDIVLAEALDRVSRDQADVATLFKHLRFAGVQIITLAEGEISELHVGLKGTMNALYLKDLAAKTHRGLRGRVEKGKAGGGLCYGYDVVKRTDSEGEPVRGERKINEAEAVIVRRIFREFATGKSPRAIATDLNRDTIPGPFGHTWGDTTIRGHASQGNGIVNNELYAGVLVWNRQRFIKDPNTGKRVSRPNPEAKWIRAEVPELRIVDDELWQRVKLRQAELAKQFEATTKGVRAARAQRLNGLRRPAFLLSGLLICGCCGGRYGIVVNDHYGCLGHFRKGICDNGRTVRRDDIERRVLAGLTDKLVSPEAVAAAVRAYAEETNRQNHERRAQAEADRRSLEKIERGINGIMAAIEDGMYQPAMKARMGELESQKAEIKARLAAAPADIPDVHPNIAELYRAKVIRLVETLTDPESNGEAREDIRSLVGEVVLTPGEKRGQINAILRGELMAILDLAAGRRRSPRPEVITTALAGPRNHLNLRCPGPCGRGFAFEGNRKDSRKLASNVDLQLAVFRRQDDLFHQRSQSLTGFEPLGSASSCKATYSSPAWRR